MSVLTVEEARDAVDARVEDALAGAPAEDRVDLVDARAGMVCVGCLFGLFGGFCTTESRLESHLPVSKSQIVCCCLLSAVVVSVDARTHRAKI
jgi:hypothetical protein